MSRSEIVVLLIACLLFALGMPTKTPDELSAVRQEQQAEEEEILSAYEAPPKMDLEFDTYKVTFKSSSREEESIADILWLKKAAQVAMEAGVPYFNVVSQKVSNKPLKGPRHPFKVVEGTIDLDNDPMETEYDAQVILNTVLEE